MPTQRLPKMSSRQVSQRARWTRATQNITMNDPDGWLSDGNHGPVWWYGLDSGGLASPIGPNGPWPTFGPAQAVVTRATSLICGPLSAAPYRVQDLAEPGAAQQVPRWLTDPMLLRPDARFATQVYPAVLTLARSAFWSNFVRNALWFGVGAFLCVDDEAGQPLAGTLRLLDPQLLYTERGEDGSLRWVIDVGDSSSERAVFDRDGRLTLGPISYRIVVLRNPLSPIDAEGRSFGVFEMSPGAFQLGASIEQYAAGTFRSGIPSGYLQVETPGLTDIQAQELKAKWMTNHGGDRRSIAVLNATTRFQPLNFSPVDAALDATKRLNIGDVAYAFGLDPLTLGVSMSNSGTYQNVMAAWTTHRDYGLSPWISALQDVLSALLAGSAGVLVNLDSFANPPLKDRVATGAAAVKAGLLTRDEWRAAEGLAPLPEPEIPPALEAFQGAEEEQPQPEPPTPERLLKIQPWKRAGGTA